MTLITLQMIDGPERGKVFRQIPTPVTIGREAGNDVQLTNDDRISRSHLRIHEQDGRILLTDLQSTNGTRVNGESVQNWHLRHGDLISVGRSVFLFGSVEEIACRLADLRKKDLSTHVPMGAVSEEHPFLDTVIDANRPPSSFPALLDLEIFRRFSSEELATLHLLAPPMLPVGLSPMQVAQLTEFLQYIQLRLRYLVSSVHQDSVCQNCASRPPSSRSSAARKNAEEQCFVLGEDQWHNFLDLYGRISLLLDHVAEP